MRLLPTEARTPCGGGLSAWTATDRV